MTTTENFWFSVFKGALTSSTLGISFRYEGVALPSLRTMLLRQKKKFQRQYAGVYSDFYVDSIETDGKSMWHLQLRLDRKLGGCVATSANVRRELLPNLEDQTGPLTLNETELAELQRLTAREPV
jgi:hypothetical protein